MAMLHITGAGDNQVEEGRVKSGLIVCGTGFSGTITVYDNTGSGTSNVVSVITNPVTGVYYPFYNFKNGFKVVASTTCDITAMTVPD